MSLGMTLCQIRLLLCMLAACLMHAGAVPAFAADQQDLWAALKAPGHIAFIRHALAPGGGDPGNFKLGDCTTQRNLSDAGRRQAKRTGDAFRANGIAKAAVYSSQWCRCNETAELLGLGEITPVPALNSLHRHPENEDRQVKELRAIIASMDLSKPVVMVSHQFTIRALMNTSTRSGEIVVVNRGKGDSLSIVGKITPRSTE